MVVTVLDAGGEHPIEGAGVRFVGGCEMDPLRDHATTGADGRASFYERPSLSHIGPVGSCPPGGACAVREFRCAMEVSAAGYIAYSGPPSGTIRLGRGPIDSPPRAVRAALSDPRTTAWMTRFPGNDPRAELTELGTWRVLFGRFEMLSPFFALSVTASGNVEVTSCPCPRTPITMLEQSPKEARIRDGVSGVTFACRSISSGESVTKEPVEVVSAPTAADACAFTDGADVSFDLGSWRGNSGFGWLHLGACSREQP
jgi:hypothetical protein